MSMKLFKSAGMGLALGALSIMLGGCLGSGDTIHIIKTVANPTGTLTGKVIDASTRQPIGGATVTVIVTGTKRTTTTSTSTDPDLTGTFAIAGLPSGGLTVKIDATGYATMQSSQVYISQSYDNSPVTQDLGTIAMAKAFDLTVVATLDGTPVQNATIVATADQSSNGGLSSSCDLSGEGGSQNPFPFTPASIQPSYYSSNGGTMETTATTDASGHATLTGLNQCVAYMIVAPAQDTSGNGNYDYITTVVHYNGATQSAHTVSLALAKAGRQDSINIVASSTDANSSAGFGARNINVLFNSIESGTSGNTLSSIGPTSPLIAVFNYPVQLTGDVTLSYINDMVNPDLVNNSTGAAGGDGIQDASFGIQTFVNVSATMDSTGTIMTIAAPSGGWPNINQALQITGGQISATYNGQLHTTTLQNLSGGLSKVYVSDNKVAQTTTNAAQENTMISVDNFNGSDPNSNPSTTPNTVSVLFPEYVTGTYRLVSYTQGTGSSATTTQLYNNPRTASSFSGTMIYSQGSQPTVSSCSACGAYQGVRYALPLGASLADGDQVTVIVDVTNALGTKLQKTLTLTVQ